MLCAWAPLPFFLLLFSGYYGVAEGGGAPGRQRCKCYRPDWESIVRSFGCRGLGVESCLCWHSRPLMIDIMIYFLYIDWDEHRKGRRGEGVVCDGSTSCNWFSGWVCEVIRHEINKQGCFIGLVSLFVSDCSPSRRARRRDSGVSNGRFVIQQQQQTTTSIQGTVMTSKKALIVLMRRVILQ